MRKITYIRQQNQSDCGVACLKMILNYYDSDISFFNC
ncbi:cysteine peptidase family C39 domain-containing protein [Enterococcus hirae]